MNMTKSGLIRLMYTIVITILIYILSTFILSKGNMHVMDIIKSMILGIFIWFVAENLFGFAQKKWPHSDVPSYLILILIIGLGTGLGSFLLGVDSVSMLVWICLAAELFGVSIVSIYKIRYKKALNKQLENFKKKI